VTVAHYADGVLASIAAAQETIIAAEEAEFVSTNHAAAVMVRIRSALIVSGRVPAAIRAYEQAQEAARAEALREAIAIVYTMSQTLAAVSTDHGETAEHVADALVLANRLLTSLQEVRQ
jgi:nickel-dependent lactate racemase